MTTENDEMLAGMTDEERAALAEPDEDTSATQGELEDKAKADAANQPESEHATEQDDQEPDGNAAGAAAAPDPGAAAAAEQPSGQPAAAAEAQPGQPPSAPSAPLLVAKAPEDADAKLAEIKTSKAELRKKYDDGDITFDEYEAQKEALDDQRMDILRAVEKAQIAQEMEQQRQKNAWDSACATFLDGHKATYQGEANKEAFAHLNETIIALTKMPRNASLTDTQLLEKAHQIVMMERGTPVAAKPAEAKPAARQIPKPDLPPDVGRLPAAGGNDPSEGKWASLDRIRDSGNGVAYEKALAALSEADREAYLSA